MRLRLPIIVHPQRRTGRLTRPRLLLVERDATLARVFGLVLTSGGYAVTTCATAADAERRLREVPQAVHAVLGDVATAQGVGEQFARALHEISPNLPVILLAPHGVASLSHHAPAQRVAAVLEKPVDVELLLATVDSVFEGVRLEA